MTSATLIGKKFGLLTVKDSAPKDKWGHTHWNCVCDCGNMKIASTGELKNENIKSCGCLRQKENHHRWKGGKIEIPCSYPLCNKVKLIYPSRKRIYKKLYCSSKCYGKHLTLLGTRKGENSPKFKKRIKVGCAYCGNLLEIKPCLKRLYRNHFCKGTDCQWKWNSKHRKGRLNSNYRGGTPEMRIIRKRISASMRKAIRQNKAGRHWENLVDYKIQDLIKHLKSTVPNGYSWEKDFLNAKNVLHIDHIIPMSAFNFNSPDDFDFKRCFGLKNLQLLPAMENDKKSARIKEQFQPGLAISLTPTQSQTA